MYRIVKTAFLLCLLGVTARVNAEYEVCEDTVRGVSVTLNHGGIKYVVGNRMRPNSIYAKCRNGKITCMKDEGIPDQHNSPIDCDANLPKGRNTRTRH